ncbi:hypothetical protein BH24ACT4_BH24ACT4_19000 [soil metagenome]
MCTTLDQLSHDVVSATHRSTGRARAQIVANLVETGIAAGMEGEVVTVREHSEQMTTGVLLDALLRFLTGVAERDPQRAAVLAHRTGTELRDWAQHTIGGITDEEMRRMQAEADASMAESLGGR